MDGYCLMIDYVAEVSELVGKLSSVYSFSANPLFWWSNRIRTLHGFLSIKKNTLSLEPVTAVLNEKHVLAPPKDIAEAKNAYEIYEGLDELNSYSVEYFLTAHSIMTRGLVEETGVFCIWPVSVVDSKGHVLYFGTFPQYVPNLVIELLDWAKTSEVHILIDVCSAMCWNWFIPLSMEVDVWGYCGTHCRYLNGIQPLFGSWWNLSAMNDSRGIMWSSMLLMAQESLLYLARSCFQLPKHHL